MDKIILENMRFEGICGCLPEEKLKPQCFIVTVVLFYGSIPAKETDDLADTDDYSVVYDEVKSIVTEGEYNLIEFMADLIAKRCLEITKACKTEVTVSKPDAPVKGVFDSMKVVIERER